MDKNKLAKIPPVSNNINYATVIYDLHIKLKKAKNNKEKVKIYSEFSQNYLMSNSLWRQRFWLQKVSEINKEAVYHFYYNEYNSYIKTFYPKMLEENYAFPFGRERILYRKNDSNIIETWQKLLYPHNKIQEHLMWYEKYSSSPIPKEIFDHVNKMEKLYWKIKASEDNLEKWIKILQEANDPEFVKQNVEHRIGQNLMNKKLWKLYISYLRETDPKEMLQVYSKYCRFFIDDFEMFEEYKNAVEKYGPVYVPWKNVFAFEKMLPRNTHSSKNKSKMKQEINPLPKFECPKVNMLNQCQPWDLPVPLIRCMIDNARPSIMSKLQQACKYFYIKNPKLYCYRWLYDNNPSLNAVQFKEQSIFFNSTAEPNSLKIFENHKLSISNFIMFGNNSESMSLAHFIKSYIYEFDVKYLHIAFQIITEKDFIFLCGRGNVESFFLEECNINDSKSIALKLENILEKLPNLRIFFFYPGLDQFLNTSNQLSVLEFKKIISFFRVFRIKNLIDDKDFCTFVKKNARQNSEFSVYFNSDFDPTLIKSLEQSVKSMLEEWKLFPNKPKIQIMML